MVFLFQADQKVDAKRENQLVAIAALLDRYVKSGAELEVNLSAEVRELVLNSFAKWTKKQTYDNVRDLLDPAYKEIFRLIETDSYPRFVRDFKQERLNALNAAKGSHYCNFRVGENGFTYVLLRHASGHEIDVYLHGAHLTRWSNAQGQPLLFLSESAIFREGKAIRGGVPIVFPQFGPTGPLRQHGFARDSPWEFLSMERDPNSGDVSLTLRLTSHNSKGECVHSCPAPSDWKAPKGSEKETDSEAHFEVQMRFVLQEKTLSIEMEVIHAIGRPLAFTAALHTYFDVVDISNATIRGLENLRYLDQLTGTHQVEEHPSIVIDREVDRIYEDIGSNHSIFISIPSQYRTFELKQEGFNDGVLWNPWIEKAQRMADFGNDEYKKMVCFEAAAIKTPITLQAGENWKGKQVMTVL